MLLFAYYSLLADNIAHVLCMQNCSQLCHCIGIISFINNVDVFITISSVIIKHASKRLVIVANKFSIAIFLSLYGVTITIF